MIFRWVKKVALERSIGVSTLLVNGYDGAGHWAGLSPLRSEWAVYHSLLDFSAFCIV